MFRNDKWFPVVDDLSSSYQDGFDREDGIHTLFCQCTSHKPGISVVYWSTGEDATNGTDIIGARFADGSVLQIQRGASYGISSDFSLQINSLVGVHDEQRFWCHVFKSDGTRSSCYTDVRITGKQLKDSKLRASKSSFYLRSGKQAILPCTSWKPGDPACDVQWLKVDNSDRHLLTYNLSTDDPKTEPGFQLASDFGLIIQSARSSHSGRYSCMTNSREKPENLKVHVIGSFFPLDGSHVTEGNLSMELKPNMNLVCPVTFNTTNVDKTTVFWSSGAPDKRQSTMVIGNVVLLEGTTTMSDLGHNSCYDISDEGSLVMTNCSQDGDVRYWCHVFKEGDVLEISYVDVTVRVSTHVCAALLVLVAIVIVQATNMYTVL